MRITAHFFSEEFSCKDLEKTPYPCKWVDERLFPLCQALEKIRDMVGRGLVITSGYRTKKYNATLKGSASNSQHLTGRGCDFRCERGNEFIGARELYRVVENMIINGEIPDGGLGSYPWHVHYDQRGKQSRWKK